MVVSGGASFVSVVQSADLTHGHHWTGVWTLMLQHLRMSGQLIDFARTTAGQYTVSLGRLRSAGIPVPPLPEQRRSLSKLDKVQGEMDALKRMQAETTAELDALMPSILDKAFGGEW